MSGLILEVHRDVAALRALVPAWEALAADAAEPNPYYEHWMLLPALEAYGAGGDFRCIVVWDSGALVGVLPMRVARGYRGMPLRVLRSWSHRNMLLSTPLVRARAATRVVEALLQAKLAPLIEFDWIPAAGAFYGALAEAASAGGTQWMVSDAYVRALLVRDRDPRARYNSNMKNNLRRWEARLGAAGRVTPARLAPGGDVAAWMRDFLALEASGWKGRNGTALACREDDRRFVNAVFPEAFRRGRLLMTGLDLDGRPLARHVMLAAGEGALSFKLAYDEAHASCSPGVLAEVDNVRQFMETPGLRWLDSNTSRESTGYWRVWKDRRTVQRVVLGTGAAGRLAVAALPLLRLAKNALVKKGLRRPAQKPGVPDGRFVRPGNLPLA